MKCPHCAVTVFEYWDWRFLERDLDGTWCVAQSLCPACKRMVIKLGCGQGVDEGQPTGEVREVLVHPVGWLDRRVQ